MQLTSSSVSTYAHVSTSVGSRSYLRSIHLHTDEEIEMTKSMSKMTKVELINLIATKDAELAQLRDQLSVATAEVQYVDRKSLMQRAGELSRTTGVMHRVHEGHVERFE